MCWGAHSLKKEIVDWVTVSVQWILFLLRVRLYRYKLRNWKTDWLLIVSIVLLFKGQNSLCLLSTASLNWWSNEGIFHCRYQHNDDTQGESDRTSTATHWWQGYLNVFNEYWRMNSYEWNFIMLFYTFLDLFYWVIVIIAMDSRFW